MKLGYALGILLASAPSASAFVVPASLSTPGGPVLRPSAGVSLPMVGGGMIERPPGDDSNPGGGSGSDVDTADASAGDSIDPSQMYEEEKGKFLDRLGFDIEINPWDPNPYIKPRPGKYGWEDTHDLARFPVPTDEEIAAGGQKLSDSERDENLRIIRTLRNHDIPMLSRSGDVLGSGEANLRAEELESKDPWYGLNTRLGEAVRFETEDVDYLRDLIAKVGGPPPSLVAKSAENVSGHVAMADVLQLPPSNSRLERILDRRSDSGAQLDGQRKEFVKNQIKAMENPRTPEMDRAEVEKIAEERRMEFYQSLARQAIDESGVSNYIEEKVESEKKEREELLKRYGATEDGDDDLFYGERVTFVDRTMKEFAEDMKRMNSNFYDDFDEDEYDDDDEVYPAADESRPLSKAAQARAEALKNDGSGRPRLPGDPDVTRGELDPSLAINEGSVATTGPLTVEVSSGYNAENSDPPMRKHCFQYTVRITNNSENVVQLLSRRFEIQTVGSSMKDVVQGEGVTGRQPVLQPGEVFEYTSTAPLSVRPIGTTEIAARMSGDYRYVTLESGQERATDEQVNGGQGEGGAELGMFHFVFPEEERVQPVRPGDDDDDDDEDDAVKTSVVASSSAAPASTPPAATDAKTTAAAASSPASSLPGEPDMTSGNVAIVPPNDSSDTLTSDVRVVVTSSYRPERSDSSTDKHCFAYNVRITNEATSSGSSIQLVSRRFEIQTVGSTTKDVVQGPGVTGRQPVLRPGESFEYTSTAPLSVRPMLDRTKVVARMSGEYNFVKLADDGKTPLSSSPLKAELGSFHFILPQ